MHIRRMTVKAVVEDCLSDLLCDALTDAWNYVWDLATGGEKEEKEAA